ncbi:phage-related minor tail protein [Peptoniphilus olsenii]|uniref:Phage-related minor tail protein n=1 Tax=Peptoniphilus olsenii TaxID=411570 RepID=A0ABV2J7H0_9FIRM
MAKSKIYDATLRLVDKFSEPLKTVDKHLSGFKEHYKRVGQSLWHTGKNIKGLGEVLTKNVTAPILAIGALSTKAWHDVDDALDTIVTKTGATGDAMKGFEDSFKKVSKNVPVDMQKVGDAIGEVNTQFGLTGKELEDASEYMIKFADINGQDVSQASIQAKQAMSAYGLEGDKLTQVLDAVTKTAQDTGQGTDKLFDIVTRGAPQIKSLGLEFEQATALLGNFEQSGIDSSKAMSYMSKAQVTFAKDGKDLSKGLTDLQKELNSATSDADKLSLASKYFGTKGATFMLDAIERGALNFEDFADASKLASGAVGKTFEEALDPIDKLQQLINNAKLVGYDLFEATSDIWAPILDNVIDKIQRLTDWFGGLSDEQKQNIVKWAGIIASVGPILVVFGNLIMLGGKLNFKLFDLSDAVGKVGGMLKFIKGPGFIAIGVLMAIIAVAVLLIKNWDKIRDKAEQIFPGIGKTISNIFKNIKIIGGAVLKELGQMIVEFKGVWVNVWSALSPITEVVVGVIKAVIKGLIGALDGIIEFFAGVFTGNWRKALKGFVNVFKSILGIIPNVAKSLMNGVISFINKGISGLNKIQIPEWVPGIGGKGIKIPLIPQLAQGTDFWKGGIVQIHERGGEIVDLPRGSRVLPHDKSVKEAYKMGKTDNSSNVTITIPKLADQIIVRKKADIDKIMNSLANELKIAKLNRIGGNA